MRHRNEKHNASASATDLSVDAASADYLVAINQSAARASGTSAASGRVR